MLWPSASLFGQGCSISSHPTSANIGSGLAYITNSSNPLTQRLHLQRLAAALGIPQSWARPHVVSIAVLLEQLTKFIFEHVTHVCSLRKFNPTSFEYRQLYMKSIVVRNYVQDHLQCQLLYYWSSLPNLFLSMWHMFAALENLTRHFLNIYNCTCKIL